MMISFFFLLLSTTAVRNVPTAAPTGSTVDVPLAAPGVSTSTALVPAAASWASVDVWRLLPLGSLPAPSTLLLTPNLADGPGAALGVTTNGRNRRRRQPPPPAAPPIYFRLVQTWPFGYCLSKQCKPNLPNDFTLHGLWPCNAISSSPPLLQHIGATVESYPDSFQNRLRNEWQPLVARSDVAFWNHEWDQHGNQQEYFRPAQYFNYAMDMKRRVKIKNLLENDNIFPGNSYPSASIKAAIHRGIGGENKVVLRCNGRMNGNGILVEVFICVDSRRNFIACGITQLQEETCSADVYYYPG